MNYKTSCWSWNFEEFWSLWYACVYAFIEKVQFFLVLKSKIIKIW